MVENKEYHTIYDFIACLGLSVYYWAIITCM